MHKKLFIPSSAQIIKPFIFIYSPSITLMLTLESAIKWDNSSKSTLLTLDQGSTREKIL